MNPEDKDTIIERLRGDLKKAISELVFHAQDAVKERNRAEKAEAERDAWKADAEALGEALGLLAIATGRMDAEGKVTAALAAHAKLKGGV